MPDLVLWARAINTKYILSYIQKAGFKIYFALNNYLPNILVWNSVNLTKRNSHGSLHFASQSFLLLQQCNFFCQEKYTFLCFWNCNKLHNNAVNLSEIATDKMMHRPGLHAKTYIFYYCIFGSLKQKHWGEIFSFFTFLAIFKHE